MTQPETAEFSPWFYRLILAALLAFTFVGHLAWLLVDGKLIGYDELAFFEHLVKYQTVLAEGFPPDWFGWLGFSSYPGVPFFAATLVGKLAGFSMLTVRLTPVLFHLLWIVFIYLLARRLDAPLAGLVAAFVVALSPLANVLSRHFASFAVLAAMQTFAVYMLVRTRYAVGAKGVLLTGLALALALLSERGTPVLMLAGPLLFAVGYRAVTVDRRRPMRAFWQVGLAVLFATFLSWGYLAGYIGANTEHTFAQAVSATIPGRGWTFYLDRLRSFLVGEQAAPLIFLGVALGAWRKDARVVLAVLWLALPLAALSAIATRDMVYVLSLTAPLALLAGLGAEHLPRRWWRVPIFALLLFFVLLNWIRVGNPTSEISVGTRDVSFFGLFNGYTAPTFDAQPELDLTRFWPLLGKVEAGPDDLWLLTGAPDRDEAPRRREIAQTLQRLMQLREVPGRYLVARDLFFADTIDPAGTDQHLVLLPGAAAPPGSYAAFLARPVFDPRERAELEPLVASRFPKMNLEKIGSTYAGLVRITLWQASLSQPANPAP
jgi:4-amino-4-deoxy-L-arabinose transferase-like glycosyltransferase